MNTFYNFQWAQKKDEVLFDPLNEYNEQKLMRGEFLVKDPFEVNISEGRKFYDIVHFQDPFNFAISEKLYEILIEAGFTGWQGYKITINDRDEKYFGFQVSGRCGELKRPKAPGIINGYTFEERTWDGADFFCPDKTLLIFCTDRVIKFLKANHISNVS